MSGANIPKLLGMTEDQEVGHTQKYVVSEESQQLRDGYANYSGPEIKQAIVHSRQDIILVALHLSNLNKKSLATFKSARWTNLWLFGLLAVMSVQTYLLMMQKAY